MEAKILKNFNSSKILVFIVLGLSSCRNGDFENRNFFEITQTPVARFSSPTIGSCEENSTDCKKFSILLTLEDSNGKPVRIIADQIRWFQPQLKDLKIESQNLTEFRISGILKLDKENPDALLNSSLSITPNRGKTLTFNVVINPQSPLLVTEVIQLEQDKEKAPALPNVLHTNYEIIVANAKSKIVSDEYVSIQQQRVQLNTQIKFSTAAGVNLGDRTLRLTILYPYKETIETITSSSGEGEFPLSLNYNLYENEMLSTVIARVEFPKIFGAKIYMLQLSFNLDSANRSPLADYKFSEENPDEGISIKATVNPEPLEISPSAISISKELNAYELTAELKLRRKTNNGSQERILRNIPLNCSVYKVNMSSPTIDILSFFKTQSTTDKDGKIAFEFKEGQNPIDENNKNIFWILRFEIPALPKVERAYFLYSPATGVFSRYAKSKLPLDID